MKLAFIILFLSAVAFSQQDSTSQQLFNQRTQQTLQKLDELKLMVDSLRSVIDSMNNWINLHSVTWYFWEVDSTQFVNGEPIRNPDGSLQKRADGTYKIWKQDNNGKLIPNSFVKIQ